MTDIIKNGYLEAVLFLFSSKGQILIEHRPISNGKEIFIPNGRIDTSDLNNSDYRIAALNREIREEFSGLVIPKKIKYLGQFDVIEKKIRFFGYLITDWEGEIPKFTVENSKKFADLEWIPASDFKKYLKFESALFFVRKSIQFIK